MIGVSKKNYTRLILHKENENEIYVNHSENLKQHQIDSLRFLYRQYKKKKLGAVLNFPPGSGKSFIVALFLNALMSVLKESVLILCTDDEEMDHWKQLLLTWTDFKSEEIAVESSNPRLKKQIFLKKPENLTPYLRCYWSIVVVKDDNICKAIQKVVLDTHLKIWITSTDVKKDLQLLLFIYNWMYPKSNLDLNKVLLSQDETKDHKMVKSIIMDTFFEDFVIRENKVKIVGETNNSEILKRYRDTKQITTRKKNKDVTGTKIKKSKITMHDTKKQINNLPDINTVSTNIIKPEISGSNVTDMEINNKSCEGNIASDITISQAENDSLKDLQINPTYTNNELDFKEAIDDIVDNENNSVEEQSTESLDFGDDNEKGILDNKNILYVENKTCTHEDIKHSDNTSNNINMELDTNVTTEKSEKSPDDLDYKMSELEEKTMKKFKGSLLDSIF